MRLWRLPLLLALVVLPAIIEWRLHAEEPVFVFGTTVVIPSGLKGLVYDISPLTTRLTDLTKARPRGAIYTSSLNIQPQDYSLGFPGITDRVEWFAIDYSGRFWIDTPGSYRFDLTSDDGALLYIDDLLVIDNNGIHPPTTLRGSIRAGRGIHTIRVSYFQGPKYFVALVLKVSGPDEKKFRIFNTEEFKPPPNPDSWELPARPILGK